MRKYESSLANYVTYSWSDNMAWQILELQKRFVNRNYILNEIIGNMVTHYCFHEENLRNYPMNGDISLNWARGFYHNAYEPFEKYITQEVFDRIAASTLAGHNISSKGVIPTMSLAQFMKEMKKPVVHDSYEETCGATPAGYIPPITSEDWPVEIEDYFDEFEPLVDVDSDTNFSRYGGMKKVIGVALDDKDYDLTYNGAVGSESFGAPITSANNQVESSINPIEEGCNGSCRECVSASSTNVGGDKDDKAINSSQVIFTHTNDNSNFTDPAKGGREGIQPLKSFDLPYKG